MAIDTNDEKLALMEPNVWDAAIPLDEATPFGTGDKLQLLWDYPFDVIPDPDESGDEESPLIRRSDDAGNLLRGAAPSTVLVRRGGPGEQPERRSADDASTIVRRAGPPQEPRRR